jgi:hypothetical protein
LLVGKPQRHANGTQREEGKKLVIARERNIQMPDRPNRKAIPNHHRCFGKEYMVDIRASLGIIEIKLHITRAGTALVLLN